MDGDAKPVADVDLTRRELIKLGAAAAVAVTVSGQAAAAQEAHAFFTADEFALADELSEMILPTDAHSPGARAAKVADYIDARLAEAFDEQDRVVWREGLRAIDRLSGEMAGAPFLRATPDQRLAVLTRIAQREQDPQTPEERFFVELKGRVVDAYYSTEIGIKEMDYKGNVYLPEFVGVDVS